MVYITENSNKIVNLPRVSKTIVDRLIITNQTTKQKIEIEVDDTYTVDFSQIELSVGQYDYHFMYHDTIISSGILQYGNYTPINNEVYDNKINLIQYTPNYGE